MAYDENLSESPTAAMDFTGRVIRTMIYVGAGGIASDDALARWVDRAVVIAESLPPK